MWSFLSRGYGETEGYSSMAEFKGAPLQALAREICQNSLDASDKSGKPVIVEFKSRSMKIDAFPGMKEMRQVIQACYDFWNEKGDNNTKNFLDIAKHQINSQTGTFRVLQVSDYNTNGVRGAFSDEAITPWGSLVKGNAFSVKSDTKNAAGSFGIGKAAPFITSYVQTVFYRTKDADGVQAAMGVTRLMAHKSINKVPSGEDPIRRSVGYYGTDSHGKPSKAIPELDAICKRTEVGTDLFIPGFNILTSGEDWVKDIFKEILENFLYAIYTGKLEVYVENRKLTKSTLENMIMFTKSKDAQMFYDVIKSNPKVNELTLPFHNLGQLRLRILYAPNLNRKVLVVRNSGMRIAKISGLPRHSTYTGFLELQGDNLNEFFRNMENPKHDAWEPSRYDDQEKAKRARQYKNEVEQWVVSNINKVLLELNGDEVDINTGDIFNYKELTDDGIKDVKDEVITDKTEEVQVDPPQTTPQRTAGRVSIRDEGTSKSNKKTKASEDPNGDKTGHRHRTGTKPGGKPTGRKVKEDPNGPDTANVGEGGAPRQVPITARIISGVDGTKKLVFTAEQSITYGRIEIVARGENGSKLQLHVKDAQGNNISATGGRIVVRNIPANEKQTAVFTLSNDNNYALGVQAYEDK